jgi:hypothetical protein
VITLGPVPRPQISDSKGNLEPPWQLWFSTLDAVLGLLNVGSFTVTGLPLATVAGIGARAFVTDSNSTTFANTLSGGGTNIVPVYSDGFVWRIG